MDKRYAIVRVDKDYYLNSCPAGFEEINNDFVCAYRKDKVLNQYVHNCKNCRYGDTKEQMIKKIAQILFQESPHNVLYTNPDKVVNEFFYNDCLKTATKIIEFLGVK